MKAVVPGGRGVGKYKPLHKPDLQKSDNNPSTSVSLATIGAIEEGQRRRPYLHTLRALADSLELTGPERVALLSFHVDCYVYYCKHMQRYGWSPMRIVVLFGLACQFLVMSAVQLGAELVSLTGSRRQPKAPAH